MTFASNDKNGKNNVTIGMCSIIFFNVYGFQEKFQNFLLSENPTSVYFHRTVTQLRPL